MAAAMGSKARPAGAALARGLSTASEAVFLGRGTNQALGIAKYAKDFVAGKGSPSQAVCDRTALFFADSYLCGASAIALRTNAPTVLRNEALAYSAVPGSAATLIGGGGARVPAEKAVLANSSAVREWDSNGTNFGYRPERGHKAGEFGHNDFYPVVMAAAQEEGLDGKTALDAMICLDEIRGRLAEVFSLKSYKIDHVVHGAIASAAVYGALKGASEEQIESAIGMVVAHHVPFRAIRAGKQLSDSKGASAAISSEAAVVSVKRSMAGFMGPRDIFRNPEAIFRLFEGPGQMLQKVGVEPNLGPEYEAPFDLELSNSGDDFTIMGMHFKLGLYEHQSAGAIQGVMNLLPKAPSLLDTSKPILERIETMEELNLIAYEPAYGIIGDPAKMEPTTRQSADHSMAYIISTLMRKAMTQGEVGWTQLMLDPYDYSKPAIFDEATRALMQKIKFTHGGKEYDDNYPDGIPTSVELITKDGVRESSGMVMYPAGHARNTDAPLLDILDHKFKLLGGMATKDPEHVIGLLKNVGSLSAEEIKDGMSFEIKYSDDFEDAN